MSHVVEKNKADIFPYYSLYFLFRLKLPSGLAASIIWVWHSIDQYGKNSNRVHIHFVRMMIITGTGAY